MTSRLKNAAKKIILIIEVNNFNEAVAIQNLVRHCMEQKCIEGESLLETHLQPSIIAKKTRKINKVDPDGK